MSTITAVTGKAIVVLDKSEDTLDNGLIIPENARKPSAKAVVHSSGIEEIKVGDHVLLTSEWAGAGFTHEGQQYVVVLPEEILGILEG